MIIRLSGLDNNTFINNQHGNYISKIQLGNTSLTEITYTDNDLRNWNIENISSANEMINSTNIFQHELILLINNQLNNDITVLNPCSITFRYELF